MAKQKRSAKGWNVTRLRKDAAAYTIRFKHAGGWRRLPGFSDETASDQYGRRLRRLAECREAGLPLSPDMLSWVRGLPESVRSRLEAWHLIDPQAQTDLKSLPEHIDDWHRSMVADDRSTKHANQQRRMVTEITRGCSFRRFVDIDAGRIKLWLADLDRGISTRNHYKQAIKQFSAWMVDEERAPESPVGRKKLQAARVTDARQRRALSRPELANLILATGRSRGMHGQERMTGPHRAACYIFAVVTGLRAAELRSLRRGSFDLDADPPTVRILAAYAKGKRLDTLAFPLRVARFVRPYVEAANGTPVFPLPRNTCAMMHRDLDRAGIDFADEAGRRFDFHALRVQCATELERGKAGMKVRQERLRHSTIALTMNTYTLIGSTEAQTAALDALPG